VARIRQIKPGFFLDDELASCCRDTRLLFIGLWVIADREGRLQDRPARIKVQVFPYDPDITLTEIEHFLEELSDGGFISRYTTDQGKRLIEIRNFSRHQHFHAKEPTSELPSPEQVRTKNRTSTVQEPDKTDASTVQEPDKTDAGTEPAPDETGSSRLGIGYLVSDIGDRVFGIGDGGVGEGTNPPPSASASKRLRRETNKPPPTLPELLTDQMLEWCETAAPQIDPQTEAEKFLDYHLGKGTRLANWPATFRGWVRIAIERAKQSARGPTRRESVEEHNRRVFAELEAMDETAIRVMQGLDPDRGSG
jgi:hypothetical protein